jgi:hypothetical protein
VIGHNRPNVDQLARDRLDDVGLVASHDGCDELQALDAEEPMPS